ncbi:MAG: peptidyl-prolyl cis-trans isomerase [Deltaproteobacteria bacterium]|jgi:peptidyl-prolyl cis-trans isomerase C|nr:peptidyl-prolyl cis-trans isomerase [Deltaproteobacteria bacterium]
MNSKLGKLLFFLPVFILLASCKPKEQAAQYYVQPQSSEEKAKLEKGQQYKGENGKLYLPVHSLAKAPKPNPQFKKEYKLMKPYQAKNGKNYYFPKKALEELGIDSSANPEMKKSSVVQKVEKLDEKDRKKVVAVVNGEKITVGELYDEINSKPLTWRRLYKSKEKKKEFLINNLISDMLIYKKAIKNNVDKDKSVQRIKNRRMRNLLSQKHRKKMMNEIKVTDEEAKEFYQKNIHKFVHPEGMIAAHILVKDKALANKILKKLNEAPGKKAGIIWRKMVKEHSLDEDTKHRGGLLISRKHRHVYKNDKIHEKPLVDAIWSIKVDRKIAGPVKTSKGWHIVKRYSKRRAMDIKFKDVKRRMYKLVRNQKINKMYNDWIEKLKNKYKVKVYPDNLKFVEVDISNNNKNKPLPAKSGKEKILNKNK